MKKIVSIFLCALMILSVASVGAFAGPIVYADGVNNSKIACVDFLDFSKENNDWWAEQKEDGTWSTKDDMKKIMLTAIEIRPQNPIILNKINGTIIVKRYCPMC